MEIGKLYMMDSFAPPGIRNRRVKVVKLTKTTVWVAFDDRKIWLYNTEFKLWAKEITSWTGSKLIHNFI
jgi:hypothetical protein